MMGRTIVVGDIHGCYDELMELLQKVSFGTADRVVAVGDLITKGPKNREVLDLFMRDARFRTVMGNHDLALRRKWNGEKVHLKASQKATHKELKKDKETYLPFLNKLPFTIDLNTHLVVPRRVVVTFTIFSEGAQQRHVLTGLRVQLHIGTQTRMHHQVRVQIDCERQPV
jgi:hypothetical protein